MTMRHPILLLLAAAAALAACRDGGKPRPYVSSAPAFDVDSALSYVRAQCAFGPRVPNTPAHDSCGAWIAAKFEQFGAQVTVQEADARRYDGAPVRLRNIVAAYRPSAARRVLVCAHWDSRPWADHDADTARRRAPIDGANDGASGVGVLLELARQLGQRQPNVGVDLICFDAEDCGVPEWDDGGGAGREATWCLGSQHWAAHPHAEGYRAEFGILLDMVGGRGTCFRKEGYSMRLAPAYVDRVWAAGQRIGYQDYFVSEEAGFVTDDHVQVNRAGIPCVDVIGSDRAGGGFCATWHTSADTYANIDPATLKAAGQTVVEVVYSE